MHKIHMEELVPVILEVLDAGNEFRLFPRGTSMLPTIVQGTDSVMLARPENVEVMDAVLYRRANGQYVLHRIVAEHDDSYDMCGDNQIVIEKGVPKTALIAKVTGIYKGQTYVPVDDKALVERIRKHYAKKPFKRFLHTIKRGLYPIYQVIFKRKNT